MESKLAHVNIIIMNLSVSIGAFKVVYSANGFLSREFLLSVKLINCVGANRELFKSSGIKIIQVSYIYRRKAPSSNCKYLTKRLFDDL